MSCRKGGWIGRSVVYGCWVLCCTLESDISICVWIPRGDEVRLEEVDDWAEESGECRIWGVEIKSYDDESFWWWRC